MFGEAQIINFIFHPVTLIGAAVVFTIYRGVRFVPQNRALIVERFGKYNTTMLAGLNFLIPFIDRVAHDRSLKEQAIDVPSQSGITADNINLVIDGVLYLKVLDPYKASYGVDNYRFAVIQLAQTTMRSEIGKIALDKTFEEREQLNTKIVTALNGAAETWGVQVLRYEISNISPPTSILEAMEKQVRAEREKRAVILESEGERQSAINVAEGQKAAVVLAAEANKEEQVLLASGEAEAIQLVAVAQASALEVVGKAAATEEGQKAVQLDLAKDAIEAKRVIGKSSTVVLMDGDKSGTANTVAEAIGVVAALNSNDAFRAVSKTS